MNHPWDIHGIINYGIITGKISTIQNKLQQAQHARNEAASIKS